jgi:hypothetical protein
VPTPGGAAAAAQHSRKKTNAKNRHSKNFFFLEILLGAFNPSQNAVI